MNEQHDQLLLSIEDTSRALGKLGRTSIYRLIESGALEVRKIGRRTFITASSVARLAESGDES